MPADTRSGEDELVRALRANEPYASWSRGAADLITTLQARIERLEEAGEDVALSAYYDGWIDGVIVGKRLDEDEDMERGEERALFGADWLRSDTKADPAGVHCLPNAKAALTEWRAARDGRPHE